jgi:hypothetical protein
MMNFAQHHFLVPGQLTTRATRRSTAWTLTLLTVLAACGQTGSHAATAVGQEATPVAVSATSIPSATPTASAPTVTLPSSSTAYGQPILFTEATMSPQSMDIDVAFTGLLDATAISDQATSRPPYVTRLDVAGVVVGCGVGRFVMEVEGGVNSSIATWSVGAGSGTGPLQGLSGEGTRTPAIGADISAAYRGYLRCA